MGRDKNAAKRSPQNQKRDNVGSEGPEKGYRLASDSAACLEGLKSAGAGILNLYLSQNRFYSNTEENKPEPMIMKLLGEGPVKHSKLYSGKMEDLLRKLHKRNRELAESFPGHEEYEIRFADKLMLGEGGVSPSSNIVPLKLHPLYGAPYLPASTIKGGMRGCWNALFLKDEEENPEERKLERTLFGSLDPEESASEKLVFFDTFPTRFELALDIQNPHYSNYYQRKGEPTDDQKLTPIPIICLKNVSFRMQIACRSQELWEKEKDHVRGTLEHLTEVYGMGAKTALGYGGGELIE